MKIYINNEAINYKKNGIVEKHFKGFAKTAREENAIIIVRPVNPITKVLLPQKYPTKYSYIKNKSSDWGIQNGFVISLAELTFLSKEGLTENETQIEKLTLLCNKFSIKLDKNNQDNNKISLISLRLKEDETILTINIDHFQYLISDKEKNGIVEFENISEENIFIKFYQPENKLNQIIVYLEKVQKESTYKVYYIFALDNENKVKDLNNRNLKEIMATEKNNLIYFPITVFCKEITQEKKPIIPDYDLFAVCWLIDHSIKYHQPLIPTNSFGRMKRGSYLVNDKERDFNQIFTKVYCPLGKPFNFEQDKKLGNVLDNSATALFLDKLNRNLGYEEGINDELRPIHHTFELVNPSSKNFPEHLYTVFLPSSKLLTDFIFPKEIIINNQKKISYFIITDTMDNRNYLWTHFLEPLLIYFQTKGYYVPNNCFIKQTDSLGFANSSNPWVKKIREEQREKQQLEQLNLDSKFCVLGRRQSENNKPFDSYLKEQEELTTTTGGLSSEIASEIAPWSSEKKIVASEQEQITIDRTFSLEVLPNKKQPKNNKSFVLYLKEQHQKQSNLSSKSCVSRRSKVKDDKILEPV